MSQLPHLHFELEDITILKKIGGGDAGIVFEASIASFNCGETVALKVVCSYSREGKVSVLTSL